MSYHSRIWLLIGLDSIIVLSTIYFSQALINPNMQTLTLPVFISSIALLLSHHLFSFTYKLYKKAWEYASVGELISIFKVITLTIIVTAIVQQVVLRQIDFRILAITWMIHLLFIGGSRFVWRVYRDTYLRNTINQKRTLIIGAGSAGTMVARQLLQNHDAELQPVAFIDDNTKKQKLDILGIPVAGGVDQIEKITKEFNIANIVIAIPSLNKKQLNHIFKECAKTNAKTQMIPMLEDLMTGKVSVNQFRDVQVEDLLGRETIELDITSISEYVTNKVILVTGAGGSIGSEICRQISSFKPKALILLGHGENSIYTIELELKDLFKTSGIDFITEIADLQDYDKLSNVIKEYQPHVVYHAAAHKHVPLMERSPEEAVKNNMIGTRNIAQASSIHGVETFVMISTDKAVNPTSVMGSTKRLAEMIIQHFDQISPTRFVAVRFGNVLGSRGSVIPLFKKQIQSGGPVTVTHPDMVRYFMTIPEASRLVIQAGALAKGGEIFVLDMGEPVKIVDLAINLIKLSGNNLDEIGIEYTGMRPGEKLFEELLGSEEVHEEQIYPKIYIGKTSELYIEEIDFIIKNFKSLDRDHLRKSLLDLANARVVYNKKLVSV
ncbi:FlaA1/EpsC-like NDP-sugar epimerase [Metabacillus crassostreae]|uniref:polysaccharide biosynthesis protein n=1 Tax=Metabacillus crassostreae TaxID=929098 RepID=UPI001957B2FF|nr:nucleoside-diphosphate sugar epimerase/dehydratase [Metabacillus crassostreae]MBM7604659.1 FlaA1/EpsC-like NDP-sugar epimerase [Metabacillus crassostreae]